ncbi:hypothetical protein LP419_09580 [Massilia sp. H-1]|nr:hypothetical protein LP419_09580 [Massilia sp. H-1]
MDEIERRSHERRQDHDTASQITEAAALQRVRQRCRAALPQAARHRRPAGARPADRKLRPPTDGAPGTIGIIELNSSPRAAIFSCR